MSTPLYSPPITYGWRMSPKPKPTRTSSSTSGRKTAPLFGPAPSCDTGAQPDSNESDSHGKLSFTRPSWFGSSLFVTIAMTRPLIGLALPPVRPPADPPPASPEQRALGAAVDLELGPVAVLVEDVAGLAEGVLAGELGRPRPRR